MNPFPVYYHHPLLHSISIQGWQRLMQIWIDEICSGRSKEIRREFLKFECLNRTQTDILYLFEDCHLLLAVFDLWQFIPDSVTWKRAPFWLGSAHLQSQKRLIAQFSYQNMVEVKTTPLLLKFTINILWAKWMSNPSKMLIKMFIYYQRVLFWLKLS